MEYGQQYKEKGNKLYIEGKYQFAYIFDNNEKYLFRLGIK